MNLRIIVKYRLSLAIVIPYSTRHMFYLLSHIVDKPQDPCSFLTTSRSCDYCSQRMTQRQHTRSIVQRLRFLHFRIPRFMRSYHMTHFILCPRNFLLFPFSIIRKKFRFLGSAAILVFFLGSCSMCMFASKGIDVLDRQRMTIYMNNNIHYGEWLRCEPFRAFNCYL